MKAEATSPPLVSHRYNVGQYLVVPGLVGPAVAFIAAILVAYGVAFLVDAVTGFFQ